MQKASLDVIHMIVQHLHYCDLAQLALTNRAISAICIQEIYREIQIDISLNQRIRRQSWNLLITLFWKDELAALVQSLTVCGKAHAQDADLKGIYSFLKKILMRCNILQSLAVTATGIDCRNFIDCLNPSLQHLMLPSLCPSWVVPQLQSLSLYAIRNQQDLDYILQHLDFKKISKLHLTRQEICNSVIKPPHIVSQLRSLCLERVDLSEWPSEAPWRLSHLGLLQCQDVGSSIARLLNCAIPNINQLELSSLHVHIDATDISIFKTCIWHLNLRKLKFRILNWNPTEFMVKATIMDVLPSSPALEQLAFEIFDVHHNRVFSTLSEMKYIIRQHQSLTHLGFAIAWFKANEQGRKRVKPVKSQLKALHLHVRCCYRFSECLSLARRACRPFLSQHHSLTVRVGPRASDVVWNIMKGKNDRSYAVITTSSLRDAPGFLMEEMS
ncbi:hypothetical protein EMCG_07743 [[Emmonsia] crescens]|uniref:F-box domain-containing protein n=1 Tax=[Emmonsia] crescens TaxID=73230 RepID=A0A0G2J582_9EURO|nr:hypothetical protein EMCG_07743 [Emmonsia crescens UAMH 3008]